MNTKTALIIGAGIGGLATSIRLAIKGYQVKVFEANSYAGGKLTAFEKKGYRFDAGPSLFTMPHYIDELFKLAGKNPKDHFNYQKMETACHYFWEDGTTFKAHAETEKFASEASKNFDVSKSVVLNKLKHAQFLYQKTGKIFMEKSLHKTSTWFSKEVADALLHLPKYDLYKTMHEANAMLKNPKLTQLFDRYATYNGSSPYLAPGILNVIPHLEHGIGTFLPHGGMHAITTSLVQLAKDLGVEFNFNSPVEKLETNNGKVTGAIINGEVKTADLYVTNMDVVPTYRKLIPQEKAPEKTLKQERSSSALIFYWGIKKDFPQLDLHNILFSENYKAEFDHLFQQKTLYHDPTVYINITSKYEVNDAPKGCENWFVMINSPANVGQDWDNMIPIAREHIIQKINKVLKTDITPLVEVEEILEPRTIESKSSSYQGALYGAASNNKFAAFLRHPNFNRKLKNLFHVGGSVHPGGGIPLCLLSAKIVDDLTPTA